MTEIENIGHTQPHTAYAALTHGIIGRWTYASRVFAISAEDLLRPLEQAIATHLIPALTSQSSPSEATRDLLALPVRFGGLGLVNPTKWSIHQQKLSVLECQPLTKLIVRQEGDVAKATAKQRTIKRQWKIRRQAEQKKEAETVIAGITSAKVRITSPRKRQLLLARCHTY